MSKHVGKTQTPGFARDTLVSLQKTKRISACPTRSNLFVGRGRELREVCSLLENSGTRLVTLTGPPGIGKTRLAEQVAATLGGGFKHGAPFVSLAHVRSAEQVAAVILAALGMQEAADLVPLRAVSLHMARRQMLLVLDNFEHLLDARLQLAHLMSEAPGLKLLVTSREALHLHSEHEYVVPPLLLPSREEAAGDDLEQYEAISLFIERARLVQHDFKPGKEDLAAIRCLCWELDGLPLAIELAAARLKSLSPRTLAGRTGSLDLLTGGPEDGPTRHRTMRSAIEWSYKLLDESEKRLFRRLAVFKASFTPDAAGILVRAQGLARRSLEDRDTPVYEVSARFSSILDTLQSLADKSLLRRETTHSGEVRFSMLRVISEYAAEQLTECGDRETAARRHAYYYLHLAESAAGELRGPAQVMELHRLECEWTNLEAALCWFAENEQQEELLRMAVALHWFWFLRGHHREGGEWLHRALDGAKSLERGKHAAAYRHLHATALYGAGVLAREQARYRESRSLLEESRRLFTAIGDQGAAALAVAFLALAIMKESGEGSNSKAMSLLEQSTTLCEGHRYRWGLALSLLHTGFVLEDVRRSALAEAYYRRSLALFREERDSWGVALSLTGLGNCAYRVRHYSQAESSYARAMSTLEELQAKGAVCWLYTSLGHAKMMLGKYTEGLSLYEKGLPLNREMGNLMSAAYTLNGIGEAARARGDYREASDYYRQSMPLFQELGDKVGVGWSCHNTGVVEYHAGNLQGAGMLFREGLELFREADHLQGMCACLHGLAATTAADGQVERAATLFAGARAALRSMGMQLDLVDDAEYKVIMEGARAGADATRWQAGWDRGTAISLKELLSLVIGPERGTPLSPTLNSPAIQKGEGEGTCELTTRELAVLHLVAQGLTNREIGEQLKISPRTINAHMRNIFHKLDVPTRSAATRVALERGLV